MSRQIYNLTKSDLKKVQTPEQAAQAIAEVEADKARLGKKYSIRKRDVFASNLRRTAEYFQGKGQGALDRANGLEYSEERSESAFNLGYYTGYTETSNLKDLIAHNENFAHLRA